MLTTAFNTQEKRMLQYLLPRESCLFSRFFFANREARKYMVNPHHVLMAEVKRKLFNGEIKRLIVNIPPGYSKTEEWVVNLMAEGLSINPQALFMHLSYADDLALWNSTQCRDIVSSQEFQELFPMKIRNDVSSKKKWYTEQGGGVYATSAGGQVTGFRAGRLIAELEQDPCVERLTSKIQKLERELERESDQHGSYARSVRRRLVGINKRLERRVNKIAGPQIDALANETFTNGLRAIDKQRLEGLPNFWGALIIDDPIKPDDAYSDALRNKINNRFMNTFKSRLAVESETPMILIMQRIHEEDPSGFLLAGGTGEKWHHLLLPVSIPEEPIEFWYPKEYTHGVPIPYELEPGPLWKKKHNAKQIEEMERADPYTFASQYMQHPSPKGGKIFRDEFWQYFSLECPPENITATRIYCDTAQKAKEHNDWTVFELWGYVPRKGIYLLDLFREKLETPEIETALIAFWNKHKPIHKQKTFRAQCVKVEDKSSGSGLIQTIQRETHIPIEGIQRGVDKVTRALDVVPHIASGNVHIPSDAPWIFDFLNEARKFTPLMTHKFDDQLDPMMDAIEDMLINADNIYDGVV